MQPHDRYRTPPKAMADLVDAPLTPMAMVTADRRTLLLVEVPALPGIAEVAQPELRLAGVRINPRTNGPSRRQFLGKLTLLDLATHARRPVTGIPAGARVAEIKAAPDSSHIALTLTEDDGVTLWVVELARAHARPLGGLRLNPALGASYRWAPDSSSIVCRTVPADRGDEPAADPTPGGPIVQENAGQKRPARTEPDLLKNAHDEALFEHYLATQLVRVGLDGEAVALGRPGLIVVAAPSPDGRYLLVESLHRPFSYRVTLDRFPLRSEVWDAAGRPVHLLADNPLADAISTHFSAVRAGPRDFEWRDDVDATACWLVARDGGDPTVEVEIRDEMRCLAAPFTGAPVKMLETPLRLSGVLWGTGQLALVTETWWDTRKIRTTRIAPDDPTAPPHVLWDRSWEDRYGDPGWPFMKRTPRGSDVLHVTPDGALILAGAGASPEGDRPFLDRLDLELGTTTRLWRSEAPTYESVLALLDERGDRALTRREAVAEPPQYHVRSLAAGTLERLSDFPHPTPALAGIQKRLLRYKRADGIDLTAKLYLPPGYDEKVDGRLPVFMWVYPQEWKSGDAAGQVSDSPYRFARVDAMGPLFALLDGFAVLDGPTMPIVGEGKAEPNDRYRDQLVAGARAAIEEVARLGVGDRDRVAVGGHSYGAFTTANLLAHSDLFRAGIARSGAYNRTLTPFGFQQEQRNYWEATETYHDMSPFTHAAKIKTPILLIHGQVDANSGTFPIQSERLFDALQGLGGTVRLVVLPAESHGYRARESLLHMLWEQHEWLEKHVKPPREAT